MAQPGSTIKPDIINATKLFAAELTSSQVTYYTTPANTKTIVSFFNFSVNQQKKTSVWIVDFGDTPNFGNSIVFEIEPDEKSIQVSNVQYTLQPGDYIVAETESSNSVALRAEGFEVPI